ncbi:aspartate aminotransferase family protein [Phytoactinopolyspora mesophila]|uniref:Aminotransferase class III-fold pyridoxal phosphate-dependent enzyme n=1 Tax=Phytoactinopolyspora mesophila TaxID=2650750 RepID=A0A7K3MF20_9ACTN|nr:aminotransferase class III-fold pyridoxal phosphate-dependent enzyme [Phytoactinopolyspora mesophila]NDL61018.1 aminotransferase class III-fold pyridoxal phosphate-dependent enzyme [Phytoactinopolyspora mesophila]
MSVAPKTAPHAQPEIITLDAALDASHAEAMRWYAEAINPTAVAEARILGETGAVVRAHGAVLTDDQGNEFLDCLAGFGSVNLGHNHPEVIAALDGVAALPGFLQIWPGAVTPALAVSLLRVAPGDLGRVFFCNSGTEAIEAAIKLVRGSMGRTGLLSTTNSFHGKSIGALSVSGRPVYQKPFGPLLPGCERVPYGDLDALEKALRTKDFGGFFVEPIQGEGGIVLPPDGYLKGAERLCRETGTLLVVDEIQTGLGRTGTLFACDRDNVAPDILCLAKGLGGGLFPLGACLARADVWDRVYGSRDTAHLHTSTFGGGSRACAVGLKTLEILLRDRLPGHADRVGRRLIARLRDIADRYPLIDEVRGRGLLIGIQFGSPRIGAGFAREYAGAVAAALLRQEHNIITINTLNNPNVMRIEPPLILTDAQADRIGDAMESIARRHRSVLGATAKIGLRNLRSRAVGSVPS